MTVNAIIYGRASADCPTAVDEQVECLRSVAASQGWTVASIFTDRPMPLKRGREQRPGESALVAAIRSGGVSKVLVVSIDRLGRSLAELIGLLETCRVSGTEVYIHDQRIDTATSNGLSLFEVASMMALHLRQSRRGRIIRGQSAARIANIRFGRPPLASGTVDRAKALLCTGKGVRETARLSGISAASVSRLKIEMNSAAGI
jgi:DNA invertase Pin-like site-specific DNA recombinase